MIESGLTQEGGDPHGLWKLSFTSKEELLGWVARELRNADSPFRAALLEDLMRGAFEAPSGMSDRVTVEVITPCSV